MIDDHDCMTSRPSLGIVVAMTGERVIGSHGTLPWDLPADRSLFRELTMGGTLIMGRRTFEGLPGPLAGRHNLVLSHGQRNASGAMYCRSFIDALALAWRLGRPSYVIGGVELYRKGLAVADTLHVSWVDGQYRGDRHFPEFDRKAWLPVRTVGYPGFTYVCYVRRFPPVG